MSAGSQSCREQRTQSSPQGKWKDIPTVLWDFAFLSKDKKSTWQNSCRESLKREQEVLNLAEEIKSQGSADEYSRVVTIRGLERLKEAEGRGGERVVGRDTGQEKQQEDEVWTDFEDYIT